jgi:hypothetical protein
VPPWPSPISKFVCRNLAGWTKYDSTLKMIKSKQPIHQEYISSKICHSKIFLKIKAFPDKQKLGEFITIILPALLLKGILHLEAKG